MKDASDKLKTEVAVGNLIRGCIGKDNGTKIEVPFEGLQEAIVDAVTSGLGKDTASAQSQKGTASEWVQGWCWPVEISAPIVSIKAASGLSIGELADRLALLGTCSVATAAGQIEEGIRSQKDGISLRRLKKIAEAAGFQLEIRLTYAPIEKD